MRLSSEQVPAAGGRTWVDKSPITAAARTRAAVVADLIPDFRMLEAYRSTAGRRC